MADKDLLKEVESLNKKMGLLEKGMDKLSAVTTNIDKDLKQLNISYQGGMHEVEDTLRREIHDVEETLSIFKHGMDGVKKEIIEKAMKTGEMHKVHLPHKLLINIRNDEGLTKEERLTEQEKKLAEFFTNQYDDSAGKFKELTFTEVKKDAPVDRSKIHELLKNLVERGIILKRETDYKVYYKMNFKAYD